VVALDIKNIINPTKNVYKIINYNKLNELIKSETWLEIYSTKNVNKCYDNFICKIVSALNMATTIKTKNTQLKEWMTSGLLISLRRKQELSFKVKKHPLNHKLRNHYIKYKNNFTTVLRMAKKNFYESKFIEVSDSPKFTWKLINDIISTKNKNDVEIKSILVNNEIITTSKDPVRVSNIFIKFLPLLVVILRVKLNNLILILLNPIPVNLLTWFLMK